jgi:glycosyltransferase involved in cell wall biosynthesis
MGYIRDAMRLLFVVDGRSPIALNWIEYFILGGHEVHLASTYPCQADPRWVSYHEVPVAFSGIKRNAGQNRGRGGKVWSARLVRARTRLRQWLGPLTLPGAAQRLRGVIAAVGPDLIHAMRIPYEGMLAALAEPNMPLLVSVWGNDFTLHAPATPLMRALTRRTLRGCDALHTDCRRDGRLALSWGFEAGKPVTVLPGAGGVQSDIFFPPAEGGEVIDPAQGYTVINPRGYRAYVRNDTFFEAIPLVIEELPGVSPGKAGIQFICPNMAGEDQAKAWVRKLGIGGAVELLPAQTRPQMAELFRRSQVAVSPSTHDGTPNTLLEAMACGCFPVAGDLESLREWITPGVNGLLFDPADPGALAEAILRVLRQPELRRTAREQNLRLVRERAEYGKVMGEAVRFYQEVSGARREF